MDEWLVTLIAVALGGGLTYVSTRATLNSQASLAQQEHEQARRTDRHKFLISLLEQLVSAYAAYEAYLAKNQNYIDGDPIEHAEIIGRAQAVCLAANDVGDDCEVCLEVPANSENLDQYKKCCEQCQNRLTFIALRRLTRNFVKEDSWVEVQVWKHYHDRNRSALVDALKRLSYLAERAQHMIDVLT